MINKKHIAFYVADKVNKDELIHQILNKRLLQEFIVIENLTTAVFSKSTLEVFIDEELKHDHFAIQPTNTRNLISFSDGEQKKALLQHITTQTIDCIILENVFDHLDIASQAKLREQFNEKKDEIIFIQIVNRKSDILPFIELVLGFNENNQLFQMNIIEEQIFHWNENIKIPASLNWYENMGNPLVEFKGVSVSYEERCILKNINWQINKGEFWQLIGPNGSGKSTLLSMITGDNPKAYNQNLVLFGRKKGTGETIWDIKAKVGYVNAKMTHYFERRDTIENMVISGLNDSIGLYIKPSEIQIQLAGEWLKLIGLFELRKKVFVDLSNGQQRLVMIARAMIKHQPLLILDEPTTGLDDHDAIVFANLINKIAAETNTAIIYVSHRKENGLIPEFVYELLPSEDGSTGSVLNHKDTKAQSSTTL
jgi:molybdate transport system ATP-binding protein